MAKSTNESFQKFVARMRGKGSQLFVIGLAVILGLRVVVLLLEAGGGSLPQVEPTIIELTPTLTPESDTYKNVIRLTEKWKEFDQSKYRLLAVNNIFDPKRVMEAADIEKEANRIYSDALVLFQQGSFQEARTKVEEALSLQGNHFKARELRAMILERLGIKEDNPSTIPGGAAAKPPAGQ